jgi:hypothetical protein
MASYSSTATADDDARNAARQRWSVSEILSPTASGSRRVSHRFTSDLDAFSFPEADYTPPSSSLPDQQYIASAAQVRDDTASPSMEKEIDFASACANVFE